MSAPLLAVENLSISFPGEAGPVRVVDRVSLSIAQGETLALVGESGSGKSMTALATMRLVPKPGRIEPGTRIAFEGRNLLSLSVPDMRAVRGAGIGMIFQEPMTSLNPVTTVGEQVLEAIELHTKLPRAQARSRVIELFGLVGIPDAKRRFGAYPHQLSGGLKQRVMIAMAMAMRPRLLIADEPTTGLDVTTQAVIMDLIRDMVASRGIGVALITHDLALASQYCDRIVVMHAGHVVETAPVAALFAHARHPYTAKLLSSVPSSVDSIEELSPIEGNLPDLRRADLPPCRFSERCARRQAVCEIGPLPLEALGPDHLVACRRVL